MTVQFPGELVDFMDQQIGHGYASREEVIREAFRLLAQRDSLRLELDKAAGQFDLGEFREYDEASLEARFRELSARAEGAPQRETNA